MDPPVGFATIPEAVYLWTAPGSESIPLWGLLARVTKRDGENPGRFVVQLFKSAYAFTRAGKRIIVPPGGIVMGTLTHALEPLVQLAAAKEAKEGCAAIWLRAKDKMPQDGGETVFAYDLKWETSPDNQTQPRFWPRELLAKSLQ
jgi:hypothetical protein